MTDDARSQFVAELRVTADHLTHLQDRLREGIIDLRRSVGLGRIAWGLRVQTNGGVAIAPGVAFAPGGVRLAIDTAVTLTAPGTPGLFRVVLRAGNSDREALRVDSTPTLILLTTSATIEPDDGSNLGGDALPLAAVNPTEGGFTVTQDDALFVALGHHTHSGQHLQDSQGRGHYDGPPLSVAGPTGPGGPPAGKRDAGGGGGGAAPQREGGRGGGGRGGARRVRR